MDMNPVLNSNVYKNKKTYEADKKDDNLYGTPQFNNITFEMPQYPFYYQPKNVPKEIVCNDENREPACSKNVSVYCSCVHLYQIKLNDIVEIIFVNGGTKDGLYIFFNIYFFKTSSIYFLLRMFFYLE